MPNLALFQPGSRHYTGGLHKSQAKLEEKGLKCAPPNYHCPLDEVTAAHYDQAGQLHAAQADRRRGAMLRGQAGKPRGKRGICYARLSSQAGKDLGTAEPTACVGHDIKAKALFVYTCNEWEAPNSGIP